MVDTQHFCLRWNNYQSSITSAFENLRDDEDFVDVTLACEGKSLKAHRVVLSACSPYFRELLKVNIILHGDDFCVVEAAREGARPSVSLCSVRLQVDSLGVAICWTYFY